MPIAPIGEPDVVFLRNIGLALLAATIAVGSIGVAGSLNSKEPQVMAGAIVGETLAVDLNRGHMVSQREE